MFFFSFLEIEIFIADEKASFTKEDLKEGKHIEYAKSLQEEMIKRYQRCLSPPKSSEQESSFPSDLDWFDVGSSERQSDGENTESNQQDVFTSSSKSPWVEPSDMDDFQLEQYSADDDDLGKL